MMPGAILMHYSIYMGSYVAKSNQISARKNCRKYRLRGKNIYVKKLSSISNKIKLLWKYKLCVQWHEAPARQALAAYWLMIMWSWSLYRGFVVCQFSSSVLTFVAAGLIEVAVLTKNESMNSIRKFIGTFHTWLL